MAVSAYQVHQPEGAVSDILARVRISEVYRALIGIQPRRIGPDTFRGPAAWRNGDGLNVSLDDCRGVWHDFVSDEGGGVLDLIQRVRGGSRADALRWCADLAGVPLSDEPLTPVERTHWAAERRELERELPTARYWQRAAVSLGEETLVELKAALFDPSMPAPAVNEIADMTGQVALWRRLDGTALVKEYHWWLEHHPGITGALVRWAKQRERIERRALRAYTKHTEAKETAA